MVFSKYIWDLYRNSEEGQKQIQLFRDIDVRDLSERFNFYSEAEKHFKNGSIEIFRPYHEALDILKGEIINNSVQVKPFQSEGKKRPG